jgi:hypothetical protein
MDNKVVLSIAAVLAFSFGYWGGSRNPKVVTKTETIEVIKEVEKIVEVEKTKVDTVTKRKTISKPDGTTVVKEKIVDRTVVEREAEKETSRESKKETVELASLAPRWHVGVMGTTTPARLLDRGLSWGAFASYRILGPFTIGAAVQNNASYSVLLGIQF